MEIVLEQIVYWCIFITGSLALVTGTVWLSFKMLTFILKSLGIWREMIKIAALYYSMKRNAIEIGYKGRVYRIKESK